MVRRSRTDLGPIASNNLYRAAGLYGTSTLSSNTPAALLQAALGLLPSGAALIALHPECTDPAWWQVATTAGENRELADWTPGGWKLFSAGKGKNGLKLFLLPRVPLEFPLPAVFDGGR